MLNIAFGLYHFPSRMGPFLRRRCRHAVGSEWSRNVPGLSTATGGSHVLLGCEEASSLSQVLGRDPGKEREAQSFSHRD